MITTILNATTPAQLWDRAQRVCTKYGLTTDTGTREVPDLAACNLVLTPDTCPDFNDA